MPPWGVALLVIAATGIVTLFIVLATTGSSTTSSSDGDSELVPPAEALATLENGGSPPTQDEISSWRARLGLLETYCRGTERHISDVIVTARKIATDHGADVTYTDAAIGITREASAGGASQGQDCERLATDWVVSVATP